jgi:TRAP-type C4-dicarboxylate transport system permease small subunit
LKNTLLRFHEQLGVVSKWLNWAAGATLVLMLLLVNANVVLRPLGLPIWGTYEIVGLMGSVVLSFALVQATYKRGHMAVEILINRFSPRVRSILSVFNSLAGFVIMSLVAWQSARFATRVVRTGEVSATLKLPFYPFLYAIAAAFGIAAIIVLVDFLTSSFRDGEK